MHCVGPDYVVITSWLQRISNIWYTGIGARDFAWATSYDTKQTWANKSRPKRMSRRTLNKHVVPWIESQIRENRIAYYLTNDIEHDTYARINASKRITALCRVIPHIARLVTFRDKFEHSHILHTNEIEAKRNQKELRWIRLIALLRESIFNNIRRRGVGETNLILPILAFLFSFHLWCECDFLGFANLYSPSLRSCTGDEFMCTDGNCVSISFRCDGDPDCMDASDEADCRKFCFFLF